MEKAKRNELRALGKAATKAPWARAPKGTGAIYIHAVYVGTEKRHGWRRP